MATVKENLIAGEVVAWLHEPTGNVFRDGECQELIAVWQRHFADTLTPDEIAADFVPLVRAIPAQDGA